MSANAEQIKNMLDRIKNTTKQQTRNVDLEKERVQLEDAIRGSYPTTQDDIDFEQELYNHFGQVKDFTLGMRIGQYFYKLGKQSGSSEVPKDLEEAADEMAIRASPEKKSYSTVIDRVVDYNAVDRKNYRDGIIAGAKWQKEQMLKGAVAVEVVGDKRDLRLIDSTQRCLFNAKRGDWLKIIIVKEDEK